ncbi:POTRA domain-containing protein [Bizionia sp. KMM 8389]
MYRFLILFIIIYCCATSGLLGQNFYLEIQETDTNKNSIIDSLGYSKKHKNYNAITEELNNLKKTITKLGYLEAEWFPVTKKNDSTFSTEITLGNIYKTAHIYFDDKTLPVSLQKQLDTNTEKKYFTVSISNLEETLNFINLKISEDGQPFSQLKTVNIKKTDNKTISAELKIINKTKNRFIDKIVIKGYEKFPRSYLKHYLKLKTGKPINLTEVKNQTNKLTELAFAKQIKEPEILFSKDSTILYVYIEKIKSNAFDGFLGFGTNEETNKLEITGYLNLALTNNLNFGETFSLAYRSDESDQKSFNVNLAIPYLFNTPLGTELQLNILKRDSSFTTAEQTAKLNYQLNPKNQFSVGINSIKSNNLLSSTNLNPFIKDYETTFYNIGYQYINTVTDNRLFKQNAKIQLETGFGNRTAENTKTSQTQYSINAFKIFNLNYKNNLFLKTTSVGLFSESYLENELARFGGINSIRGFEENSLNATFYALLATEYRYSLSSNLYIHSIIDLAYFENQTISQKEKLYSFGFGFGLETQAGLLRFNYANGKNESQAFQLSNSKIHLSLTAVF